MHGFTSFITCSQQNVFLLLVFMPVAANDGQMELVLMKMVLEFFTPEKNSINPGYVALLLAVTTAYH